MQLFAAAAAHHEPDAMHHVMDTSVWEIFNFNHWVIDLEKVFPETLHITKFKLLMLLAAGLICLIYIPLAKKIQTGQPPRGTSWNLFESLLTFIRDNVAKPYIPHHTDHYVPFLWTIFLFVLVCNLLGMLPFLGSPTASFTMTSVLAIIVFSYIHFSGISENGLMGHLGAFAPHLDMPFPLKVGILCLLWPIEFIGLIIKCFVLSVRLFANMFAGHMVLATILIFIWQARNLDPSLFWTVTASSVVGATLLSLLELFVAFLQAFLFTFLSALFLGSTIHPEH
jgi:F-type H+-transporting ATPase subunit a